MLTLGSSCVCCVCTLNHTAKLHVTVHAFYSSFKLVVCHAFVDEFFFQTFRVCQRISIPLLRSNRLFTIDQGILPRSPASAAATAGSVAPHIQRPYNLLAKLGQTLGHDATGSGFPAMDYRIPYPDIETQDLRFGSDRADQAPIQLSVLFGPRC